MARKKQPKEIKIDKKDRPIFGAASIKQQMVLTDLSTDVLLVGGGAGGGKSRISLMKALTYVRNPAARVLIVRQSFPQLKISGGLWDESHGIYSWFDAIPNKQSLTWTFPNGATIQFSPIPDNLLQWQGLQASHILVDEAAEFREDQIIFLLSRLRCAGYEGHLNLTLTCNPDRNSFLYNWLNAIGCLDEDTGVPVEGTENIVKWFVSSDGKIKWGNSQEELYEKYGRPYGLKIGDDFMPKSFRFIPMNIYDNPILMKANPGYLANLLAQNRVNQLRYLHGSWTARDAGAMYFSRDWCEVVDYLPTNVTKRVRSWDLAGTEKSPLSSFSPDFTAGVKMSRDKFGTYYVEDVIRFQKRTDAVLKEICRVAEDDGSDTLVTIPLDPGAAGKTAANFYLKTLAENGTYAKTMPSTTHQSKLTRFKPLCSLAESGYLKFVKGDYLEDFLAELELFNGERSSNSNARKDDQVDAVSDAFATLVRSVTIPAMSLPSMTQNSPVPRI